MSNPEVNFMSPMRPGAAPPMRSRGGDGVGGGGTTDSIARRRAELRRLQQAKRPEMTSTGKSPPQGSYAATGPPPMAGTTAAVAGGPPIPPKATLDHVRESDIFPTVKKVQSSRPASVMRTTGVPPTKSSGPPMSSAGAPPHGAAGPSSGGGGPQPPLARRLEFPGNTAKQRAKSAPPRRPPGPPPPSKSSQKKPTTAKASGAPPTTQQTKKPAPPRGSNRPAPVSPSSLLKVPPKTDGPPTGGPPTMMQLTPAASSSEPPQLKDEINSEAAALPPMGVKTPKSIVEPSKKEDTPPSTARRDQMKQWRQHLDSPKPAEKTHVQEPPLAQQQLQGGRGLSSSNAILEQALKDANEERNKALKQIAELEEKLTKANTSQISNEPVTGALQQLLHLVNTQGEHAAVEWARDQCASGVGSSVSRQVGFMSPMAGIPPASPMMKSPSSGNNSMETPARRKISQRALTPYPKDSVGPEEMEQSNIDHFREAAKHIPAEYTSDTGDMYVIRRPYGIETAPRLFHAVNAMPMEQYRRSAHVSDLTTIEVAVEILADRSLFLLHGVAGVQYFNNNGNNISVPNVDDLDRPLGFISYIDADANEKQYSLDEILEHALNVREQYCSAMMSTGKGFKDRPREAAAPPMGATAAASPPGVKITTSDVGTGTDPAMFPPTAEGGEGKQGKKPKKSDAAAASTKKEPKVLEEDAGSGDVLAMFIGWIFKGIIGSIWWIMITLPLKILRTTLISTGTLFVLGIVYLYMLEGNNIPYGGGMPFYVNAPGSGIM